MLNPKEAATEKSEIKLKVNNAIICFKHNDILFFNKLAARFGHQAILTYNLKQVICSAHYIQCRIGSHKT